MTQTAKQETCEQRIDDSLLCTLETIRQYFEGPTIDDVQLVDDGTLDTVIRVCGEEDYRFSDTSAYRDDDGALDLEEFWESSECDDIRDEWRERWYEYGLSFEYVEPDTYKGQKEAFFRYLISWGGPSDEFRFFVNPDYSVHKIEYWFMDWFDGACRTVSSEPILLEIWQDWLDCEFPQSTLRKALEE